MAHNVEIKGVQYVPSSEDASGVGYTSDYVARLAREGQIRASRVGRQWFVDPKSLERFCLSVSRQKEERRKRLREQRAAERNAATQERPLTTSSRVVEARRNATTPRAIMSSLSVTFAGVFVGVLVAHTPVQVVGLSGEVIENGINKLEATAVALHRSVDDLSRVIAGDVGGSGQEASVQRMSDEASVISTKKDKGDGEAQGVQNGLVVIPENADTAEQIESIKQSFSDEVIISHDEDDPQTGVITPVFRDRTGDSYRFLMVPVAEGSEP